ncbi:hypothetical protein DV738_g3164, partial [Chaetothyriales sp. CBS 135597]
MPLDNVSNIVLVLSGKGGVGKSSVTVQLALALSAAGQNVGILDIDLTGPSIPRLLGIESRKVTQAPGGWLPVEVHKARREGVNSAHTDTPSATAARGSLHALSLAFLLPSRESAVIWRGPKKTAMIRQFVSDIRWPPGTDYLLIDTPPGTSDEHIAIVEELHKLAPPGQEPAIATGDNTNLNRQPRLVGAVVVTTPQAISTADVRKELNFCQKTSVPVIGVIENMSGYVCPCCGEVSSLFSKGGGRIMSQEMHVNFLGEVPIDTTFVDVVEGKATDQQDVLVGGAVHEEQELFERYQGCNLSKIFAGFASTIQENVIDPNPQHRNILANFLQSHLTMSPADLEASNPSAATHETPLLANTRDSHAAKAAQGNASSVERVRRWLRTFLDSKYGHYSVFLLVSLDITSIFAEFLITLHICEHKRDKGFNEEGWEQVEQSLGDIGLAFSSLFVAELLASVFAFGLSYFKSPFHVFDAIVIVLAFIIDLLLKGPLQEAGSLVVVLRLWRVFKIVEEFSTNANDKMEDLYEEINHLKRENEKVRSESDNAKEEIGELKRRLQSVST